MARDVFISYSQPDKATADEVCRLLEAEGISCWIAPRNVPPGSTWASAIVEAIGSSKVFLLLSSHHSNQSRQMSRELQLADQQRLPVIPVRLSDVDFQGDYTYFLSSTQWLDLFPGSIAEHRIDLLSGVRHALAARDPEPTSAAAPAATAPSAWGVRRRPLATPTGGTPKKQRSIFLGLCVALALLVVVAVIIIRPSLQRQVVTGWTIRAADYTNNVGGTSTFAEKGGKRWIEYVGSDDSKPMFTFAELNRNEKGVYLHDPSRDVVIHLDLEGRKVMFRQGSQPFFSMYDIQRVR